MREWKDRKKKKKRKETSLGGYVYSSRCGLFRSASEQTEWKLPAFVRYNPISLSREIFFKRRE